MSKTIRITLPRALLEKQRKRNPIRVSTRKGGRWRCTVDAAVAALIPNAGWIAKHGNTLSALLNAGSIPVYRTACSPDLFGNPHTPKQKTLLDRDFLRAVERNEPDTVALLLELTPEIGSATGTHEYAYQMTVYVYSARAFDEVARNRFSF